MPYDNERIIVLKGDITEQKVDAVVNAANNSLMGGSGVDGAIHKASGKIIYEECRKIIEKIGKLETGKAVITKGGNLKAKYIIHTAGPVWNDGNEDEEALLSACYANCLKLAENNEIKTIAFPNISTGVYGYPKDLAADVAFYTVKACLEKYENIDQVRFVCFDEYNYDLYLKLLDNEKKNNIYKLLEFIPYFERKNINFYTYSQAEKNENGTLYMPNINYDKGIINFIKLVYKTDLLRKNFKDSLEQKEFHNLNSNEAIEIIKTADIDLLGNILTYYIREERYGESLLGEAAKDKIFLNILYRLRELK